MLASNADVICLQEVCFDSKIINNIETWTLPLWSNALIENGYEGVMQGLKQKDISKNAERNLKHVGKRIPTGKY